MKCIQCGSELNGNEAFCPNCGIAQNETAQLFESNAKKKHIKQNRSLVKLIKSVVNILIGLFLVIFFIVLDYNYFELLDAKYDISIAASQMKNIQSISGNTIDEAYYQQMGSILDGFCTLQTGVLINTAAICTMLHVLFLVAGIAFINVGVAGLFTLNSNKAVT